MLNLLAASNTARWILIFVGVLAAGVNGFMLANAEQDLQSQAQELRVQGMEIDQVEYAKVVLLNRAVAQTRGETFIILSGDPNAKKPKRIRRIIPEEFKRDVVNLVVNQGYPFKQPMRLLMFRLAGDEGKKLKSRVSKRFKPTTTVTDPSKKPADNILNQDFKADGPNQKWVTDITYLPLVGSGFVYLAVVVDLFCRKIVGWTLFESLATLLVKDNTNLCLTLFNQNPVGLIVHFDPKTSEICQPVRKRFRSARFLVLGRDSAK